MHLLVRVGAAAARGVGYQTPATAQHPPVAPATWAITGARIEPVSAPAIASGTVVIRDGRIAAVGANVPVPADARVIDGAGLTVYPGFIAGYGSLGKTTATAGGGAGGAAAQAARRPNAPNSTYAIGLQPEVDAIAEIEIPAAGFTAPHGAGITAALTAPASGVWRGQSALIQLGGGPVAAMVVAGEVAQHAGFSRGGGGGFGGGGGGGYPGSLLGVIAQIRQQLLDAQHWRDLSAAYTRDPSRAARPPHDPSLEALQPVINGTQPVIIQANTKREILRALSLSRELGFKVIIAGGREAWQVADQLHAADAAVLLDIDFPRRTAPAGGRTASSDDPPESMQVLRDRVERPKSAGVLAAAGARFAMISNGEFGEVVANLRRAVEGGLSRERAVRAVTLDAAQLFGAADRLGSIAPGRLANLTIVSGDLFAEGGRVSQVFVGGERYQIPAPAAPSAGRGR